MNKGERNRITKLIHKKRCDILGIKPEEGYSFKHQSRPCNCYMCKKVKYSRKIKHKLSIL